MNQKFRLTALALSLSLIAVAPSVFAEGNFEKQTLSFLGDGESAEKPYDGTTDVANALKSGDLQQIYITTATSDKYSDKQKNGKAHLLFNKVDLDNREGKNKKIVLSSGSSDFASVRNETLTIANSTIKNWDIQVEALMMFQPTEKPSTGVSDESYKQYQLASTGHTQAITLEGTTLEGDIIHSRNESLAAQFHHVDKNNLSLTLEGSVWTGALRSEVSKEVLHEGMLPNNKPGQWYTVEVSDDDPMSHNASVTLKNSTWTVTGESGLTSLTLDGASTVEVRPEKESGSDGNAAAKAAFDEIDGLRAAAYARAEAAPEATPFLHIAKLESMDAKSKFLLNEGSTLAIDESDSDKHTFEFKSLADVSVKVGEMKEGASTTVVADGKLNDGTQSVTTLVNKMLSSVTVNEKALDKADYAVGEGVWTNGLTGTANRTESGELVVTPGAETVNANAAIVTETTGISLMQWRTEMNDMNKRMGDLRGQKGTAGAWARTYFGRSEYGAQQTETEFQAIQVGADHLISAGDAQVWAGAAFSYTKGDSDFSRGTGETNTYALTAYASTLFDCGSFLDASLKYGRLENEFNISFWENQRLKGDFKTNAWSATLEAGHRFEAAQGFFVEPQLEMMYSRIEGDSYGAGLGTKIDQKDVDMLVGRAGLMAGLKLPAEKGNLYVHASLLHDFDGEAQTVFYRNGKRENDFRQDFGGTWYAYGFGANVFMTESLRLYGEFERTASGIVKTPYRWNVGARYVW